MDCLIQTLMQLLFRQVAPFSGSEGVTAASRGALCVFFNPLAQRNSDSAANTLIGNCSFARENILHIPGVVLFNGIIMTMSYGHFCRKKLTIKKCALYLGRKKAEQSERGEMYNREKYFLLCISSLLKLTKQQEIIWFQRYTSLIGLLLDDMLPNFVIWKRNIYGSVIEAYLCMTFP